ncbi:unnamed protein product [Symbiodinium natans]|uniref:Uncharacterized protein n=1 Tax=Symbiodinium natans TaxID=878477 RepID=A0A812HG40_9DINO|nr:unnamed protein product [Symbiodinium natans]
MPSRAFLSAVKDSVSSDHMRWFSWRVRTSEADEVAFAERRRPRTDSQMLASLLAPSAEEEFLIDIPMQAPVESVVRKFFDRLCVALAMLDACHLLPLCKLMEKFVGLATMGMEAGRSLWLAIGSLQQDYQWSLTDCAGSASDQPTQVLSLLEEELREG